MISPQITEVKRLYAEAEAALKLFERIGLDNLVSAVNELRYAGKHLLDAQTAGDANERDILLFKALRHCERAKYDAQESTIITLLEAIDEYRQSGLSMEEMTAIYPEWGSCLQSATAAQKVLENIGAVKTADQGRLETAIDELLTFRETLLDVEPRVLAERNRKFEEQEKRRRELEEARAQDAERLSKLEKIKADRQFVLSFTISAGGTIIGFLGTLIAIYGTFPNHKLIGLPIGCFGLLAVMFILYRWARKNLA